MGKKDKNKTRILIIDDHPLFREGLKTVLNHDSGFEVVGEAGNAQDGLDATRKIRPDLMTVDLLLPDRSGIELTGEILSYVPETPVMLISMLSNIEYIIQAIRARVQKDIYLRNQRLKAFIKQSDLFLMENIIWTAPSPVSWREG